MHLDPILLPLFALAAAALVVGQVLQFFRQPFVVGYIVVGVVLGPSGLQLIEASENLANIGNLGVVLLLFYVGMEISVPHLIRGWRISIIGTLIQIVLTTLLVALLGSWLGWAFAKVILFGFITTLSSTAVVLKILADWGELDSPAGRNVTGILLIQDLMLVPMLIVVGLLADQQRVSATNIAAQVVGGVSLLALLIWAAKRGSFRLPFASLMRRSHEFQLFGTLAFCVGFALATGLLGLSTALGAFAAGIFISLSGETEWVRDSIRAFHVFFVGVFFVSIGLLVDISYIFDNLLKISLLVVLVLFVNTIINTGLLLALKEQWRTAVYAGALISQIGEFSFLLAAVGLEAGIIETNQGYQTTISVISLSLLLSPTWIMIIKRLVHPTINPPTVHLHTP